MKLRYLVLLLVAVVSLAFSRFTQSASAQTDNGTVPFKNVVLSIYPEYDDPRLLVVLRGQLDGVDPPVRVRFLVPATAEIYAVESQNTQGNHIQGQYDREASEIPGWDELSYELQLDSFLVEYYDPIIFGQPDKTISYEFRWLNPISRLEVAIQQPKRSSNFQVSPAGQLNRDGEGFTINTFTYSNLDTQPPLQFKISYTKADNNPSITQPVTSPTSNGTNSSQTTQAIIVLVALVIVIVGVLLWRGKSRGNTRAARRQAARASRKHAPESKRSGKKTCPECGEPVDISDKFCRNCSNKLRGSP